MYNFVTFISQLALLGLIVGVLGLLVKSVRPKAKRLAGGAAILLVAATFFSALNADETARSSGSANEAGRRDANAKAAGLDGYEQQQQAQNQPLQKAAEQTTEHYPLDGLIGDFEDDFNNAAEYLGVSSRFTKVRCASDIVCEYLGGGGNYRVLTTAQKGTGGQTDNVTMAFTGNKAKMPEYFVHVGVLVAVYAPTLPGSDRAKVVKMIVDGLKKDMKGEIVLDGVRFTMEAGQGTGIWLFMSDARNSKNKQ